MKKSHGSHPPQRKAPRIHWHRHLHLVSQNQKKAHHKEAGEANLAVLTETSVHHVAEHHVSGRGETGIETIETAEVKINRNLARRPPQNRLTAEKDEAHAAFKLRNAPTRVLNHQNAVDVAAAAHVNA